MQQLFDMLQKLFQDIIGVVAGRGNEDGVAVKVLAIIANMFGGSAEPAADAAE